MERTGVKKFIYNLNYKVFMSKTILLESNPDFMDNTRAVYDEFIRRGLNKKFKFIWLVKDKSLFNDIKIKNTKFINRNGNVFTKISNLYYRLFSKYIIDCNNYIQKMNKYQYRLYLSHGSPVKDAADYCKDLGDVDDFIVASKFLVNPVLKVWNINRDLISVTGFPRNDYMFKENSYFKNLYKKYNKIIVWMPTFRNHQSESGMQTGIRFEYGIPCVNTFDELININEKLKENKSLLILKLHPAEDVTALNRIDLSNIILFNDELLIKKHLTIYHLLSITDALITDYSSIYFDFLETKKPICLAIPDYEEYTKHCKVVYEEYEKEICAYFAHNYKELFAFIDQIIHGKDLIKKERDKFIKKTESFNDYSSSKRVVDLFLMHTNNK